MLAILRHWSVQYVGHKLPPGGFPVCGQDPLEGMTHYHEAECVLRVHPGQLEEVVGPGGGASLRHLAPDHGVALGPVDVIPIDSFEEVHFLRSEAEAPSCLGVWRILRSTIYILSPLLLDYVDLLLLLMDPVGEVSPVLLQLLRSDSLPGVLQDVEPAVEEHAGRPHPPPV